jgi:hypothetical protein
MRRHFFPFALILLLAALATAAEPAPPANGKGVVDSETLRHSVRAALAKSVGFLKADIGSNKDLLGELAGKNNVNAIVADGKPLALFLSVTDSPTPISGTVTRLQAGRIVAELLLRRSPAEVVREDYPIAIGGGAEEAGGDEAEPADETEPGVDGDD